MSENNKKKPGPKPMTAQQKAERAEARKRKTLDNPPPGYTSYGVKIGRPPLKLTEEDKEARRKKKNLYIQQKNKEYSIKTRENVKKIKSLMKDAGITTIDELATKLKNNS